MLMFLDIILLNLEKLSNIRNGKKLSFKRKGSCNRWWRCRHFLRLPFIFLIDFHPWILSILLSSLVIVILGALDDSLQLGVTIRLISQLIASLIVIGSGLQIVDVGYFRQFYSNVFWLGRGRCSFLLAY